VGVVVPNFNKSAFVEETIRSVLTQTHPNVDLVVVDDGSTDDSVAVIRRALAGTDASLVVLENGGVSRARNAGFDALSSDVAAVLFLDADDVLEPHALDTLASYLDANPAAAVVYGISTLIDEHGAVLGREPYLHRWEPFGPGRRRLPDNEPRTSLASVYARFQLLPSGSLIRRSAFERTSGWDSSLCRPARPFHAEDKDMATQLALVGEVHRFPEPLYRYRMLPTPHRTTMYDGLKELDRKWWHAELPRSQRRRVRRAVRFNARVAMLDVGRAWIDSIGGDGPMPPLAATKNLVASAARWASLSMRLHRAGPPDPVVPADTA
jgi:glycosyltransferase involved in cell wall biosynthesis